MFYLAFLCLWHFHPFIWHFCDLTYQLRGPFYVKVSPWTPWRQPLRHTYMQSSLNRGVLILEVYVKGLVAPDKNELYYLPSLHPFIKQSALLPVVFPTTRPLLLDAIL